MKEIRVNTLADYCDAAMKISASHNKIYRGLKSINYELIPGVGRYEPKDQKKKFSYMEKRLLDLFKEKSLLHLSVKPEKKLEWLSLAQHHELPTRLMDWSYNPLVAAYFAVEGDLKVDSVVYVLWGCRKITSSDDDYEKLKNVMRYRPGHITARIAAQAGLFTVHPEPNKVFSHNSMAKIIVDKSAKNEIKKTLSQYGISRSTLFPGLDSISIDLKLRETKSVKNRRAKS